MDLIETRKRIPLLLGLGFLVLLAVVARPSSLLTFAFLALAWSLASRPTNLTNESMR